MNKLILSLLLLSLSSCLPTGSETFSDQAPETPNNRIADPLPETIDQNLTRNVKLYFSTDVFSITSMQYKLYDLGFEPDTTDYCYDYRRPSNAILLESETIDTVQTGNTNQPIKIFDKSVTKTQIVCFETIHQSDPTLFAQVYVDNVLVDGMATGNNYMKLFYIYQGYGFGINY